jgi:hypothetical protein
MKRMGGVFRTLNATFHTKCDWLTVVIIVGRSLFWSVFLLLSVCPAARWGQITLQILRAGWGVSYPLTSRMTSQEWAGSFPALGPKLSSKLSLPLKSTGRSSTVRLRLHGGVTQKQLLDCTWYPGRSYKTRSSASTAY